MNNIIVIGEEELGEYVKKGDSVVHPDGGTGTVQVGIIGTTGEETDLLGFVSIEGKDYLVSIKGKLMFGWRTL